MRAASAAAPRAALVLFGLGALPFPRKPLPLCRLRRPLIPQQRQEVAGAPLNGTPSALSSVQTGNQTSLDSPRKSVMAMPPACAADKERSVLSGRLFVAAVLSPPVAMDGGLIRAVPLGRKEAVGRREIEKGKARLSSDPVGVT